MFVWSAIAVSYAKTVFSFVKNKLPDVSNMAITFAPPPAILSHNLTGIGYCQYSGFGPC